MLARDRKIVEQKPCLFLSWNDSKSKWEQIAPAVDCSLNCEFCGWNEAEKKRRLETGGWVYDGNGVRHLLFKSGGQEPPA